MKPFQPIKASTVTVTVTATSSDEDLGDGIGDSLLLTNIGSKTCYIRVGNGAQTAVTTDMPLQSGGTRIIARSPDLDDTIAAICGGTDETTLLVTLGFGGI